MGAEKVKYNEFLKLTMKKKTLIILNKQGKGLIIII